MHDEKTRQMTVLPKASHPIRWCPFCGVATEAPHETQEGCIAALQSEIGRMRGILSTLKPSGAPRETEDVEDQVPTKIKVVLD